MSETETFIPDNESCAVEGTCESCGAVEGKECRPGCEFHS